MATPIDPDDDTERVHLLLGNVARAHAVEHAHAGGVLHRAHEDVGVAGIFDGDLADAERGRAHHDIGVEQRQYAAVPLT